MKRIIFSLVLVFAFGQVAVAQDINKLIADLAKLEGVEHHIIDKAMLNAAINSQIDNTLQDKGLTKDSINADSINFNPGYAKMIESIEVVAAENVEPEVKSKFLAELNNFKDGNGYETLLAAKEEGDNVRILAQRENGEITAVIIFAIDDEDVAIVKMAGKFSESDLSDIINEQQKKNESLKK